MTSTPVPGHHGVRRPTRRHQRALLRTACALQRAVPTGYEATVSWAWTTSAGELVPDVLVHRVDDDLAHDAQALASTPVLAVDVIDVRADDLVTASGRYAAAGLEHYWVLDPLEGTFDAFRWAGGDIERGASLRRDDPPTEVSFGVASVTIDVAALLG
ncbi:Uma2 family endonuclease [Kineococcus arenarius]|uniref:Uma2 family endonuclease n=1 Tax=Kineococcus sp. SYSU DK007 TaxID=3383128 RepID=UPI003D7D4617